MRGSVGGSGQKLTGQNMTQEGIMNTSPLTSTTRGLIAAAVDADGMARIGSTRHELVGIRYHSDPASPPSQNQPEPSQQPAAQPGQQPAAPQPPAQQPATPNNPPAAAPGTNYTPEQTQAYIATLRDEAKNRRLAEEQATREKSETEQKLGSVLAALGIGADGKPLAQTPEQLQAEIAQRTAAVDDTARENLVLRVAGPHQANADRLLDSRSFRDELKALKADDRAGVDALVKTWVEKDPTYQTAPPPAASSGSTTHTGTPANTQRKTKEAAIAERMAATPTPAPSR